MNKIGYSYTMNERNSERLYGLNESMNELMESNETMKKFKKVDFDIEGVYLDKNLELVVYYETKDGKSGKEVYSTHVDEGVIDLTESTIQAYCGMEKYNEVKKDLEDNYGILEADYLKENEPELFNQLAESYLLSCSPNTKDGSEFTDQDEIFFKDILNKEK